ncbi:hypothetical protein E2562_030948 [Oryza meyeriana var. granulata]|uniref:Uncharacterized protein n=1 Tax=Oryza meyeriana var. granulata TaxID=110450 RepID=A0A6G1E4K2_9ORYZ|nr:hypothetical protein E2562_030948 [Oryza meyeriana var. granulata]
MSAAGGDAVGVRARQAATRLAQRSELSGELRGWRASSAGSGMASANWASSVGATCASSGDYAAAATTHGHGNAKELRSLM